MSILKRRPGDDRAYFASRWRRHGDLVARLPGVLGYVQNYVEEVFIERPHGHGIEADGFVELFFHDPAAMKQAFTSSASAALREDEPHFLGHATGYHITGDHVPAPHTQGGKVVLTLSGETSGDRLEALSPTLSSLAGLDFIGRDTVNETITKAGMATGPQRVDEFVHLFFSNEATARVGAHMLCDALRGQATAEMVAGLFRVRVDTVVSMPCG